MAHEEKVCTRCVMDDSARDIVFDATGVCNYCSEFLNKKVHVLHKEATVRKNELLSFINMVKKDGKGKKYDCVIGVSGGVDSSWALVLAVQHGLRPLAVHMDNGWNSELAQNNISNLVRSLGVDLFTHVIEWHEYRKLMQAFFDADVIDVELLYDNAMLAVNYRQAAKWGVSYILGGTNTATEGMRMPVGWNWFKYDKKNIKSIGRCNGKIKLESFPAIGVYELLWHQFGNRIKWIHFLDHFDYQKEQAVTVLQRDFKYKPYPYKHYESVFTRFYQGYILPTKFHVDKRRLHLSNLIMSGQLSRDAALSILEKTPYPNVNELEADKLYFLKKMGWSEAMLEDYLSRPEKTHEYYASERKLWKSLIGMHKYIGRFMRQYRFM